MSTVKLFCTAAIMVACFAVIYPRFMHPLVLRVLGLNDPPKKHNHDVYPPGYKGRMPPSSAGRHDDMADMKKHMRGPHPGMRHAAEMNSRQGTQGSGRGGMMGVVLPMYAIGIVLYLIYTLYKVFNKSKGQTSWSQPGHRSRKQPSHDRMGFPVEFENSGTENVQDFLRDQQQRKDLEDLLTRADDKNVSVEEMRMLQKRLEETEAQMTKILAAMQSVQKTVPTFPESAPQTKEATSDEVVDKTEKEEEKDVDEDEEEKRSDDDLDESEEGVVEEVQHEEEDVDTEEEEAETEEEEIETDGKSEAIPKRGDDEEPTVRLRNVTKSED